MADNGILTVLTDVWSESVARELVRRWPDHRIKVRYLGHEGAHWPESARQSSIEAILLDSDMSGVFLSDGTRFSHAVYAYAWEVTKLFHRTVFKESTWTRLIGRFYSLRAEVLCVREFYGWICARVFLCLFARHLREMGHDSSKGAIIVFISSNPFGDGMVNYLQSIYAPTFVGSQSLYTKIFFIKFRRVLKTLLRRTKRLTEHAQVSTGKSSTILPTALSPNPRRAIAVEACLGLEMEKERSDLFWLPQSGIPDDQVLVYFDRPGTVSDEALDTVQRHGWLPVVLRNNGGSASAMANPWLDDRTFAVTMISSLFRRLYWWRLLLISLSAPFMLLEKPRLQRMALWYWWSAARSVVSTATWHAFFISHGVRLHSNQTDVGMSHHVAQSVALEWQGALNLHTEPSFDVSDPALLGASYALPFDVFFVWGSLLTRTYQEYDFAGITTLITSGYPFDYLFESARRRAASLRRELQAAGAHKIISFFDTSFCKNSFTSGKEVEDVYRALLTEVIENPLLGLVVKPKNIRSETALETPELQGLLDRALGTGRCMILEHKSYTHWVSPCEAAFASDLAVGYPINSAVIEAVLGGVPGVHIDLTKQRSHWFYEAGYERIVFDDLDRAMAAIRRWIRNPSDEPGLGDHSAVIDKIDPFRDGKASQRIGQYMAWLLEGFDQGLHRDEVVRRASRLYAEKYGAHYVRLAPRLGCL